MANINLATVLDQKDGQALVKEYIDKRYLERRDWDGVLANSANGARRPLSYHDGQYTRYTQKGRARRPEHMATPGGTGSDPASGANLGVRKVLVPIEWIHEYFPVATVTNVTSWVDLEEWIGEDMPMSLKRRYHELTQNALKEGRMTPGVYDSSGVATTAFDATASRTPTIYEIAFSFLRCPSYYGSGKQTFADLAASAGNRLKWSDIRRARVRLSNSGAPTFGGAYRCTLSEAMWLDLLMDDDDGRLTAAIAGGLKAAIKGLENQTTFHYAGTDFILDDQPFTLSANDEVARANFGDIHVAHMFGRGCFGYMPLGGSMQMKPRTKVQDITKTGYEKTIGYLVPWQVAVTNPNWGLNLLAYVSESKPNNYDPADATDQLSGFGV